MKNIHENGRSMIEMLGVLAIIGVLSVGGIMGYSKAMFRYKINKTIEQITYIAGNVRTTFANQGNYDGLDIVFKNGQWDHSLWKKAHLFLDDMWKDGKFFPQNVWDGDVELWSLSKNSADTNGKAFDIDYGGIPEEACIELLTHDWRDAQAKMIEVNDGYGDEYFLYTTIPVTIDNAVKMCELANVNNDISLVFYFDIDTSDSYWKDEIDATTATLAGN